MNRIVTCATRLTQTNVLFCKLEILFYHKKDLVHSPTVEFKLDKFQMISVFTFYKFFLLKSMFEMARECTPTICKRNLACSMITISENVTPLTLLR